MSLACYKATRHKATRTAFTLVELLVVITIIGVIAGLLTVGLWAAFGRGKDFILANEISQVGIGIESFKTKHGCYPPDMADFSNSALLDGQLQSFNAFINKAYPRANRQAISHFRYYVLNTRGAVIDPAEALVLFMTLTSSDPVYPFGRRLDPMDPSTFTTPALNALQSFHEFSPGTLVDLDGDGFPQFIQKNAKGMPLVYFDARSYTSTTLPTPSYFVSGNSVTPYKEVIQVNPTLKDYRFFNMKSYQLICAGQDGEFGVPDPVAGSPPTVFSVVLAKGNDYPLTPRPLFANEVDRLVPLAAFNMESCSKRDGDNIANFTSGQKFDSFLSQ